MLAGLLLAAAAACLGSLAGGHCLGRLGLSFGGHYGVPRAHCLWALDFYSCGFCGEVAGPPARSPWR